MKSKWWCHIYSLLILVSNHLATKGNDEFTLPFEQIKELTTLETITVTIYKPEHIRWTSVQDCQ